MDEPVPVAEEYETLQQIAVTLEGERVAAYRLTHALQGEFAAAMAARDALMTAWRVALHSHETAPTPETTARCEAFARDVRDLDAQLTELTTLRRDVQQYRRQLRREQSRVSLRVVRARRALDHALFETASAAMPHPPPMREVRSLFHDMREHLTVAVLAAGKLTTPAPPARAARYHAALIRGLTDLTEDLDVLAPLPVEMPAALSLVALPIPVPPVESALLPGT